MAYAIKRIKGVRPSDIAHLLYQKLLLSRFTADITTTPRRVEMRNIRLKAKKDYCGNHPLPCPVRPGQAHKPHKHHKFLEGADWVAFNDMVNDVLDAHNITANVGSSLVTTRMGDERCVCYDSQPLGNGIDNEWRKNSGCFENHMGETDVARSDYPPGTPGIPQWKDGEYTLDTMHEHH